MDNPIVTILMMLFGNPFGIALIIFLLVMLIKAIVGAFKKKPQEAEPEKEPEKVADYDGSAYIFINGGAPAYGDVMGRICVDGKALELRYSEAPIQIRIRAGKRHVVIEGGVVGDARLDRIVDFAVCDVLTVDLPGGADEDVIRHQMIRYYEYSKALSDSGFRVSRKEL